MTNLIEQDKQNRATALNPTQSFIVQAPAGSGKTELLIQRFLTLLTQVRLPEEILAITFTKKAANEMRGRVVKALKQAQDAEPESAHAKLTWQIANRVLERDKQFNWHLISNPNQLRIQTIDSLCTFLTKQLPLLSHFGSSPAISDNAKSLYREAVQEVLLHVEENYEWSDAIANLLLHLDNDLNKLHDLLINLLEKRDQWLPYIRLDTEDNQIKAALEEHLNWVISNRLSAIAPLVPKTLIAELMDIARFAADNIAISGKTSPILACRDLFELPKTKASQKEAWLGLANLLLTKSFSWRKRVDDEIGFPPLTSIKNAQEKALHSSYRERFSELIKQLIDQEALRLSLEELCFLPEQTYNHKQWAILKSLLTILKIVTAQLRVSFQQQGQIDFIENAQAALLALGNDEHPTDLALALDYQIKHILVDEFQDTSYTQYQLIEKLTTGWEPNDGRTLFVVGDPMQSIYRFRQAEVGLFIRMGIHGIGNIHLQPLKLAVNFRSSPSIVEWNNAHFTRMFPAFNDMATGSVTYSASASHQTTEHSSTNQITIKGLLEANDRAQAKEIVTIIQHTLNDFPDESIAILVRSRSHLTTIIEEIKKAHIPFRAVDIDALASKQSIQDLFSLTCALLHPADRIAWLSVLRAPWCGLSLSDLLIIGRDRYALIYDRITSNEVFKALSDEGKIRLTRILPIIKDAIAERERYDLRYWIERTWLLLGGPACLADELELDEAKAYFQLLSDFMQNNLILNTNKLREKLDRSYATTQHADAKVQIMTIHTAKGLEFDTIILPHLERKLPYDDKSLLSWMEQPLSDQKTALMLAPIHGIGDEKDAIYEYITRQQRIKSDHEVDRLFYVATTRAKKRLHLFFNAKETEKGIRTESGSFLEKIWPCIAHNKDAILTACNDVFIEEQPTEPKRYIQRLTKDWQNPIKDKRNKTVAYHLNQDGFQLKSEKSRFIGTVTHHILQYLTLHGIEWWQNQSDIQQKNYIQKQLKQLGAFHSIIVTASESIQHIIRNLLNDEKGRWILAPHSDAKSEFALTALIDNKVENLIIDRTFIDEKGIRWIIDYKTATLSHRDLNQFLTEEQNKYLEKMRKYQKAMQLIDNRPIRLGLYFPALPAWHEWEAEEMIMAHELA